MTAPAGTRRWLVTGAGGQLGRCLVERLRAREAFVAAPARHELDVTDREAVRDAVLGAPGGPPAVVVNAAAMTHVDRCESEPEAAHRANALAPGWLAEASRAAGAAFVQVSTDYVFDGTARRPYREDDPTGPRSVYGQTKLEGEARARAAHPDALVVRTAWLFGPGRNFVRTILEAAERAWRGAGPPLRVVDDQRGSPTWAGHLADALLLLVERDARGIYHAANSGSATWWELARAAVDAWGHPELPIEKVTTAAFPRPAPRPAWSVLDLAKAERAGVRMPSWAEGLHAYLASPGGSA
ncbi:MAG: dTDP-4-dehydrorhamnose reductase [Deltaproteobacteria bacterium]|nr:dTDP-4-dehydrorhamnose reductase [Deltaproteobacteria bacterium]